MVAGDTSNIKIKSQKVRVIINFMGLKLLINCAKIGDFILNIEVCMFELLVIIILDLICYNSPENLLLNYSIILVYF